MVGKYRYLMDSAASRGHLPVIVDIFLVLTLPPALLFKAAAAMQRWIAAPPEGVVYYTHATSRNILTSTSAGCHIHLLWYQGYNVGSTSPAFRFLALCSGDSSSVKLIDRIDLNRRRRVILFMKFC